MRRISVFITACLLALLLVMLVAGLASAKPEAHVVLPGESIQAAVEAAQPGDTIVVIGGIHHETVVIEKDGISLRAVKAVLEPPTEPKEGPCEGAGLCVLGDVDFQNGDVSEYVEEVSISGFTVRNFSAYGIVAIGARDSSFVKNRTFNAGEYGITSFFSTGTKVISNVTSGAEDAAIYVGDSPRANTKIINNNTHDSSSGILVRNALHGRITANKAHNNCVGIIFLADAPGPAGMFEVDGNTVQNNTRACPATAEAPRRSGVGIGLLGARDVKIRGNKILKNVPSGPPALSGGVVVVRGVEGTVPKNNSVEGNEILGKRPDIFWDKSGSGNRLKPNDCKTSKPGGLCKG
jgi:nitrous oxidase accessory protein NosD